jgi:GDP-L-fucose synthase
VKLLIAGASGFAGRNLAAMSRGTHVVLAPTRAELDLVAAEFDQHVPSHDYGFSKYVCAKSIRPEGNIYELRLFGVFGPHADWQVRFISNACCRAVWDLPVVIRQNVLFDYLDVADLGRIVAWFLDAQPRRRQYNVCSGRTSDLKTLAAYVRRASRKTLPIVVSNDGLGVEYSGDNARLVEEFRQFRPRAMEDSIAALYSWYLERKESIDPRLLHFDD